MILDFGSKETEKIWQGESVKKWPVELQVISRRKLRMLNNSQNLADLRIPPSNRLEKLTGKLRDYYSIRINKQWRIVFIWHDGNTTEVSVNEVFKQADILSFHVPLTSETLFMFNWFIRDIFL